MNIEQIINKGMKEMDKDYTHVFDERGYFGPPLLYMYSKFFPNNGIPCPYNINFEIGSTPFTENILKKYNFREIWNQYDSLEEGEFYKSRSVYINDKGIMISTLYTLINDNTDDAKYIKFIDKMTEKKCVKKISNSYLYLTSFYVFTPSANLPDDYSELIENIYKDLKVYDINDDDDYTSISMITKGDYGLRFKDFDITNYIPDIQDMDLYYGDGFEEYNNKLIERLINNKNGLVLFHGDPGTGKTFYIRYLLKKLVRENKRILYVPPSMVEMISDPGMIDFLGNAIIGDRKDTIILIEDAEPLLESRSGVGRTNGITNLLNSTDGILNDILGLTIICTFNTDLENIDKALLRAGRLISRKEFNKIEYDKVIKICEKMNISSDKFEKDKMYTISEIIDEKEGNDILYHGDIKKVNKIGFGK